VYDHGVNNGRCSSRFVAFALVYSRWHLDSTHSSSIHSHGVAIHRSLTLQTLAEGALRWPSELYRLNGSLKDGMAAMNLLNRSAELSVKHALMNYPLSMR
jgi:hypothetical protein